MFLLFLVLLVALQACSVESVIHPSQPISANNLSIDITIVEDSSRNSLVPVKVRFYDNNNALVEFGKGETISCNDILLTSDGGGEYAGSVPYPSGKYGGSYLFEYKIPHASSATVVVFVQPSPVFRYPTGGQTLLIPRETHSLVISYDSRPGSQISAIASDSYGNQAQGPPEEASGIYTINTANFIAFRPGGGRISLTRESTSQLSGDFRSVTITYDLISMIPVIWF